MSNTIPFFNNKREDSTTTYMRTGKRLWWTIPVFMLRCVPQNMWTYINSPAAISMGLVLRLNSLWNLSIIFVVLREIYSSSGKWKKFNQELVVPGEILPGVALLPSSPIPGLQTENQLDAFLITPVSTRNGNFSTMQSTRISKLTPPPSFLGIRHFSCPFQIHTIGLTLSKYLPLCYIY
jgi:hypothetical protein